MTDDREHKPLETLLDEAIDAADGDEMKLGDILEAFGSRSFGPVIAILAIIVISPIGAVPFLPTLFAALILLIALQLLAGRSSPWVPDFVKKVGFQYGEGEILPRQGRQMAAACRQAVHAAAEMGGRRHRALSRRHCGFAARAPHGRAAARDDPLCRRRAGVRGFDVRSGAEPRATDCGC